MIQLKFVYFKE